MSKSEASTSSSSGSGDVKRTGSPTLVPIAVEGHVKEWTPAQVGVWVSSLDKRLATYKDVFIGKSVTGAQLISFKEADFRELGVFDRKHVRAFVSKARFLRVASNRIQESDSRSGRGLRPRQIPGMLKLDDVRRSDRGGRSSRRTYSQTPDAGYSTPPPRAWRMSPPRDTSPWTLRSASVLDSASKKSQSTHCSEVGLRTPPMIKKTSSASMEASAGIVPLSEARTRSGSGKLSRSARMLSAEDRAAVHSSDDDEDDDCTAAECRSADAGTGRMPVLKKSVSLRKAKARSSKQRSTTMAFAPRKLTAGVYHHSVHTSAQGYALSPEHTEAKEERKRGFSAHESSKSQGSSTSDSWMSSFWKKRIRKHKKSAKKLYPMTAREFEVAIEGWLHKKGPKESSKLTQRWCQLFTNGHLYYFKLRPEAGEEPIGYVDMHKVLKLEFNEGLSFHITTAERVWHFECLSTKKLVDWMAHLRQYIEDVSRVSVSTAVLSAALSVEY